MNLQCTIETSIGDLFAARARTDPISRLDPISRVVNVDGVLNERGLFLGGPRIVAIGGGHGLVRTLRAARHFASAISAVVSVADDGGSSGRLRAALGIPAPGDVRQCLSALLPGPSALGRALEHRFGQGELAGHAFGNIFLAALAETTGSFSAAVAEARRLLGAVGDVIPATESAVVLHGLAPEGELSGQVRIMTTPGVTRVALSPSIAEAAPAAIAAIESADGIVIGPGSLYTSLLAALVAPGMIEAINAASARTVYVANLREQIPETQGYDVGRHVASLIDHGLELDAVIADTTLISLGEIPARIDLVEARVAVASGLLHDEELLADALSKVLS